MMKQAILWILVFLSLAGKGQSVSFNTDGSKPHTSAIVEIKSTTKGLLLPRMNSLNKDAILSPAAGLMIFNSTSQHLEQFTNHSWSRINADVPCNNNVWGGRSADTLVKAIRTMDKGYMLAGTTTSSMSGDVRAMNSGMKDIWLIKLNSTGEIEWNKLFGGNNDDEIVSLLQTNDGGAVIVATSSSSFTGGDKDFWIFKLDPSGNLLWQKIIGGVDDEIAHCAVETSDGGYVVAGSAISSNSGDVTGTSHGGEDVWIIKLDASGNLLWNKLFGSVNNESANSIQQTSDGGFVLAATTNSFGGGDVPSPGLGGKDLWVLKMNATGTIVWTKRLGGIDEDIGMAIRQDEDGTFLIAGYSRSPISGTTYHGGGYDAWALKLDATGEILWNKLFGGGAVDQFYDLISTTDGNFIFAGKSSSSANGDISQVNHGGDDAWIFALDPSGNRIWDQLIGGASNEKALSINSASPMDFLVSASTQSYKSGNIPLQNNGYSDMWIFRIDQDGYFLGN